MLMRCFSKYNYSYFVCIPRHRKHDESSIQKFSFDDGYITCLTNSHLVLGVHELEGLSSEVVLLKRRQDDVTQKWILQENGFVLFFLVATFI